jgi:hypothetical protein
MQQNSETELKTEKTPGWASALGVVAIILGVFLTAYHGTEWIKNPDLINNMPSAGLPEAVCPPGEMAEEGISLAECRFMVANVQGIVLSMPSWFPAVMTWLAALGTLFAFFSIIVGGALVNFSPWANKVAIIVFSVLGFIDILEFAAAVNAGPIIRSLYLWHIVLWFLLHMMLLVAAVVGQETLESKAIKI